MRGPQYSFFRIFPLLTLLLTGNFLHAQQNAETAQRTQSAATRAEDTQGLVSAMQQTMDTGFAPPSPGDSDLGEQLILTRDNQYRPLTFYSDITEIWTDNAALSQDNRRSDWLMIPRFGVNYLPRLTGNLFGEFTLRYQLFRYARNSDLNFNGFDATAGLVYPIRQLGDLSVYGRYHFTMLTNPELTSQIYNDHSLEFGLYKPFPISRAHFFFIGSEADITVAGTPAYALRHEFAGYVGYQVNLTRHLSSNIFYRIAYQDYWENNRSDWNQTISAGVSYRILEWFAINGLTSFGFNNSNTDGFNYRVYNVGAGVSGLIQF